MKTTFPSFSALSSGDYAYHVLIKNEKAGVYLMLHGVLPRLALDEGADVCGSPLFPASGTAGAGSS